MRQGRFLVTSVSLILPPPPPFMSTFFLSLLPMVIKLCLCAQNKDFRHLVFSLPASGGTDNRKKVLVIWSFAVIQYYHLSTSSGVVLS